MSHSWDYDAIVIGSGPRGEGAAMGLVKQGARVAVIERYHNVGGGCTHWGTIPSKALRHAVSRIIEFNQNPLYSDHSRLLRSSFADILNHADSVINQQTHMRQDSMSATTVKFCRAMPTSWMSILWRWSAMTARSRL